MIDGDDRGPNKVEADTVKAKLSLLRALFKTAGMNENQALALTHVEALVEMKLSKAEKKILCRWKQEENFTIQRQFANDLKTFMTRSDPKGKKTHRQR